MLPFITALYAAPAEAYVYVGNPVLGIRIVRTEGDLVSGSAWLTGVRVHHCGGGYDDYAADELVDPTDGWSTTIEGGDLCGVTVRWDSDVLVDSSSFELRYEYPSTSIVLTGASSDETALTPFVTVSGTFSGSTPELSVTIGS